MGFFGDSCYRGADAFVIVFSVSDRKSFDYVETIYQDILHNGYDPEDSIIIILCGNDYEFNGSREVSFEEGMEKAQKLGIEYFETIPKTGAGIEEMFNRIVQKYLIQLLKPSKETSLDIHIEVKKKTTREGCIIVSEMCSHFLERYINHSKSEEWHKLIDKQLFV